MYYLYTELFAIIAGLLFGQDEERDQSDTGKDAQNKPGKLCLFTKSKI
jgi:hypothetical protein